jgi:hypothetical protein
MCSKFARQWEGLDRNRGDVAELQRRSIEEIQQKYGWTVMEET